MALGTPLWSILVGVGLTASSLLASGCDDRGAARDAEGPEATECVGAKCDVPTGEGEDLCRERRDTAFANGKSAFTPTALRWSCSDVPGVTEADRGQEYCEYWAIATLDEEQLAFGRIDGSSETDNGLALTDAQRDALASRDGSDVIGACMFSSWNVDRDASCSDCEGILGFRANADNFQARMSFNSFGAAKDLLDQCSTGQARDGGLRDDAYYRGCLHADDLFSTGWRKSDGAICSATIAMTDCGCTLASGGGFDELGVPNEPGFHLGSWDEQNAPPPGCHYVSIDDNASRVLVACEMTVDALVDNQQDLKGWCRETYAERVVVHVPIDPTAVRCDASCAEQPWVLSAQ